MKGTETMATCEGCGGARYRLAIRGDGTRAVERCDTCSMSITDDTAFRLALDDLYRDIDEWFEGDSKERTALEMLDWVRSFLTSCGHPA